MYYKTFLSLLLATCTLAMTSCEDKEKTRDCRTNIYSSFVINCAVADTLLKITDVKLNNSKDSLDVFNLTQQKIKEFDERGIFSEGNKYMDEAYVIMLRNNKDDKTIEQLYKVSEELHELVTTPHMIHSSLKEDLEKLKSRESKISETYDKEHPASRINKENVAYDAILFSNISK